ncbi:TlpA disulfide reductase family protein [Rubrimonas cliftonensis]|uniref:Thiol-disulfide isomerase or thioredoxin n=1 Tax=Rubrimonas cliftonensis TaxID=89524 RepID=A0A1H4DJW2_9RHOB|nr:TlpA disulfide reductase family protein [Rubrimonas cliftonensis]SEA72720.1 Thiol-disulfide isomerase or thioredoxin [Rubrimonas cliftonensis]
MLRAARRLYTAALALTTPVALLSLALAGAAQALSEAERGALEAARAGEMTKLNVGDAPKPRFETPFVDGDGAEVRFGDFAGKVVLVNFWATWCPPCLKEMPALDRLAGALEGDDFAVVAISADRGDIDKPRNWLAENDIDHLRLYHDARQALSREAAVVGMPTTLLLDRQGREVARLLGDAEWDGPEARAVIEALMAAAP